MLYFSPSNVLVTIKAELQIQIQIQSHIDTCGRIVKCDDIDMTTALKMMTKTATTALAKKNNNKKYDIDVFAFKNNESNLYLQ